MPLKIVCSTCDKTLKVEERLAGKKVRCPNCQTPIVIPADNTTTATSSNESDDAFEKYLSEPVPPPKPAVSRATPKNEVEPLHGPASSAVS